VVIVLNTKTLAEVFQPQLNNLFFEVLGTPKTWLIFTLVPMTALLPDLLIASTRQIFKKNPVDIVLRMQKSSKPVVVVPKPDSKRSRADLSH
jgi:hypothetical protein